MPSAASGTPHESRHGRKLANRPGQIAGLRRRQGAADADVVRIEQSSIAETPVRKPSVSSSAVVVVVVAAAAAVVAAALQIGLQDDS
jgi:hypothetical protein